MIPNAGTTGIIAQARTPGSSHAYPLDELYLLAGRPLPPIRVIEGHRVPSPCKELLVHSDDMTPTLARHHQTRILLRVLSHELRGGSYFRQVVLLRESDGRPVEFGATKVHLDALPPTARRLVLEEQLPLGTVLHECNVPHFSRPQAFLSVDPDAYILEVLGLDMPRTLHGRRNTLFTPQQDPIAEILEILPESTLTP